MSSQSHLHSFLYFSFLLIVRFVYVDCFSSGIDKLPFLLNRCLHSSVPLFSISYSSLTSYSDFKFSCLVSPLPFSISLRRTTTTARFPLRSLSLLISLISHLPRYSLTPVHSVQVVVCLRSVAGARPLDNLGTRVWCQEPLHPPPPPLTPPFLSSFFTHLLAPHLLMALLP